MTAPNAPSAHSGGGAARTGPSVRHRVVVAVVVGVVIVTGCLAVVAWTEVGASTLTAGVALDRLAAIAAAGLFLYLTLFQIGLATGLVPGRLAWGGRHETLPPELRRASALTAPLMPLLAWLLLERAGVVNLVGADGVIAGAAWAVPLLFLLSAAGNLASASPGERRLGIPVTAALVVLSFAVAYGG